jgi:hypothetical protein
MDNDTVRRSVTVDPRWVRAARAAWLEVMDLCVFGDVKSSRLGAMTRLRKRALEAGERLRSLSGSRDWIPHSREQLKNALAGALSLRESLQALRAAQRDADGGSECGQLAQRIGRLEALAEELAPMENAWANLLDALNRDAGVPPGTQER